MSRVFEHLDLIEQVLRRTPLGLITDVDGTISQTAPTPREAQVSPLCCHCLSILCNHLDVVAAISGRPAVEVKNMIKIDGMVYIGNHGLERWAEGRSELAQDAQTYLNVIKAAIEELAPLLSIKGISIEDKGITTTIHYRLCHQPQLAERAILSAVESSPQARDLRIIQDKMAIDLLPPLKVDKGVATLDLIHRYNLQSGIYMGDDLTDINAFRAIHAASRGLNFKGFALGILSQGMPEKLVAEADFTLNGVNGVERFLKWMSHAVQSS